jgi:hypothetical protein
MGDMDRWTYHADLQTFAKSLQITANAVLPNDRTSRYEKVSVLMLSWTDEDPQLPVFLTSYWEDGKRGAEIFSD